MNITLHDGTVRKVAVGQQLAGVRIMKAEVTPEDCEHFFENPERAGMWLAQVIGTRFAKEAYEGTQAP